MPTGPRLGGTLAVVLAATVAAAALVSTPAAVSAPAAAAKAWEAISPVPEAAVRGGTYTRTIRATVSGVASQPGSATIVLPAGEPIDGNGALAGHLPAVAPLCLNRPVLLDPDFGSDAALDFATELGRHMGVQVGQEITAAQALVLFQAPEWSKYRDFGDGAFDAMVSRLYGQPLNFPSVRTLLANGDRAAQVGANVIGCRGGVHNPTAAYRAAFHAVAARHGLTVVDDITQIGPGDYFLVPGMVPAFMYQYLRLNEGPPTVHTLPARGPIVNLDTQFWVDRASTRSAG